MSKVYIVGHIGHGKTCIGLEALQHIRNSLKEHEVIEIGSNDDILKERGITINEMIEKDKSLVITNPYEGLEECFGIKKPKKNKKPYWKNGKLKYK